MAVNAPVQWAANVINADTANMDGAVLNWSAGSQSSAVALSNGTTDPRSTGTVSLKCTKAAGNTGALCVNNNTDVPVAASTTYDFTFWVQTASASVTINVNFEQYTSGQAFISGTTMPTISVPANTPTQYPTQRITMSGTAAFVRINPQRVAGLATGDTIFFDAFFLGRPIVPSGGPVFVPQGVSRACIR
jgi:hypothetical protein